jgi:hypothetical protein
MRPALHAEWTKLRTVASPLWLLLGMIAATVALSAGATSVMGITARCQAVHAYTPPAGWSPPEWIDLYRIPR